MNDFPISQLFFNLSPVFTIVFLKIPEYLHTVFNEQSKFWRQYDASYQCF